MRTRAHTIIGGMMDTVDYGLAVADYQGEEPQLFAEFEAFCATASEWRNDAEPTTADVMLALRPFGQLLHALAKKKGATPADKHLRLGLMDWLRTRLYGIKALGNRHPRKLIDEAIQAAENERLDAKVAGMGAAERERRIAELREQAAEVLVHPDPLALSREECPHVGYGGDPAAVLIGILSMTTRVLDVFSVPGAAVGHLQYEGASSAGKTFIVNTARRFFPAEAWREVGGSTKSLIYVEGSFAHCVLFFPEMDSIPKGGGTDDQNVVASAVRGLLSEHRLRYQVTVRRPEEEGGGFVTQQIDLPGPTTMITTGLGRLEKQYATRTFTFKVNTDVEELVAKLKKAGHNEAHRNTREPLAALVAYHTLIQLMAPWDVWVPFADQIADYAANYARRDKTIGPRVLRDINKIFAFIKAVTVEHFPHRAQDAHGRWIATPADYEYVYNLIGDIYQETASGTTRRLRQVVEKVAELCAEYKRRNQHNPTSPLWGPNAKEVGQAMGLSITGVTVYIAEALQAGWLVDLEAGSEHRSPSRRPYRLVPGEPLPAMGGLLPPGDLLSRASDLNAGTSSKSAATAEGSTFNLPEAGSEESLNANPPEGQAENGAFKRSTNISENGGPRPARTPIRL